MVALWGKAPKGGVEAPLWGLCRGCAAALRTNTRVDPPTTFPFFQAIFLCLFFYCIFEIYTHF